MTNYIATSVQNKRGFVVNKRIQNFGSRDTFLHGISFVCVGHTDKMSIISVN